MLKLTLERYGFEVVAASHGVDALMQFRGCEGRFGSIIANHDMPVLNGLSLVRAVREMGYTGKIVVMSGRLSVAELYLYAPYAISGFFSKPFEISMLAAMLQHSA